MLPIRGCVLLFGLVFSPFIFSAEPSIDKTELSKPISAAGSWTFSGTIRNESSEQYGYFFEIQRQHSSLHVKTALIDGQTNQLVFFYEKDQKIDQENAIDWHIGRSFIRYNAINDSWVFGVKVKNKKGFNFKVDMLSQAGHSNTQILRPGVTMQALQTSQLNGHIQLDDKEQFVTGNKTWFSQLNIAEEHTDSKDISVAYCRLGNQDGFYSAKLKEHDIPSATIAGWLDSNGNKVKMSQFISVKSSQQQCTVQVGLPKITLKFLNTLKDERLGHSIAGFTKENKDAFCFVSRQSYSKEQALV